MISPLSNQNSWERDRKRIQLYLITGGEEAFRGLLVWLAEGRPVSGLSAGEAATGHSLERQGGKRSAGR